MASNLFPLQIEEVYHPDVRRSVPLPPLARSEPAPALRADAAMASCLHVYLGTYEHRMVSSIAEVCRALKVTVWPVTV